MAPRSLVIPPEKSPWQRWQTISAVCAKKGDECERAGKSACLRVHMVCVLPRPPPLSCSTADKVRQTASFWAPRKTSVCNNHRLHVCVCPLLLVSFSPLTETRREYSAFSSLNKSVYCLFTAFLLVCSVFFHKTLQMQHLIADWLVRVYTFIIRISPIALLSRSAHFSAHHMHQIVPLE